jgi:HAD superfamily hydrolase (TIGR01549 family)
MGFPAQDAGFPFMATRPEAVLFDVGNTLLFPNWARILAPLEARGAFPTPDQLQSIERRTKKEFDGLIADGILNYRFWFLFYSHLLELLEINDGQLLRALTEATGISSNWDRILPGTREALDRIRERYRIGVISNADGKIAAVLEQQGIRDCFFSVTDSGIVGYEKPRAEIFAAALRTVNVLPENALYVGDLYSVDYLGARNAGMQALLFDVVGAYRGTELPRVDSLAELERRLESR